RRLGDERVAANRLERRARRIGRALVIPGDDPDLSAPLEPHLRRAEDVSGRMKRDPHAAEIDPLAERHRLNRGVGKTAPQKGLAWRRTEVRLGPRMGMIAVRVRDDRASDRLPGIDEEIAYRAIQAAWGIGDEWHGAVLRVLQVLHVLQVR